MNKIILIVILGMILVTGCSNSIERPLTSSAEKIQIPSPISTEPRTDFLSSLSFEGEPEVGNNITIIGVLGRDMGSAKVKGEFEFSSSEGILLIPENEKIKTFILDAEEEKIIFEIPATVLKEGKDIIIMKLTLIKNSEERTGIRGIEIRTSGYIEEGERTHCYNVTGDDEIKTQCIREIPR